MGCSSAICNLAYCYTNGYGVTTDADKSALLYRQAALLGDNNAIKYLKSRELDMLVTNMFGPEGANNIITVKRLAATKQVQAMYRGRRERAVVAPRLARMRAAIKIQTAHRGRTVRLSLAEEEKQQLQLLTSLHRTPAPHPVVQPVVQPVEAAPVGMMVPELEPGPDEIPEKESTMDAGEWTDYSTMSSEDEDVVDMAVGLAKRVVSSYYKASPTDEDALTDYSSFSEGDEDEDRSDFELAASDAGNEDLSGSQLDGFSDFNDDNDTLYSSLISDADSYLGSDDEEDRGTGGEQNLNQFGQFGELDVGVKRPKPSLFFCGIFHVETMSWMLAQPCLKFPFPKFACAIVHSLVTNRKLGVAKRIGADAVPLQPSPFASLLDGHQLVFMCDTEHVVCCVVHKNLPFFSNSVSLDAQIILCRVWMAAFGKMPAERPSAGEEAKADVNGVQAVLDECNQTRKVQYGDTRDLSAWGQGDNETVYSSADGDVRNDQNTFSQFYEDSGPWVAGHGATAMSASTQLTEQEVALLTRARLEAVKRNTGVEMAGTNVGKLTAEQLALLRDHFTIEADGTAASSSMDNKAWQSVTDKSRRNALLAKTLRQQDPPGPPGPKGERFGSDEIQGLIKGKYQRNAELAEMIKASMTMPQSARSPAVSPVRGGAQQKKEEQRRRRRKRRVAEKMAARDEEAAAQLAHKEERNRQMREAILAAKQNHERRKMAFEKRRAEKELGGRYFVHSATGFQSESDDGTHKPRRKKDSRRRKGGKSGSRRATVESVLDQQLRRGFRLNPRVNTPWDGDDAGHGRVSPTDPAVLARLSAIDGCRIEPGGLERLSVNCKVGDGYGWSLSVAPDAGQAEATVDYMVSFISSNAATERDIDTKLLTMEQWYVLDQGGVPLCRHFNRRMLSHPWWLACRYCGQSTALVPPPGDPGNDSWLAAPLQEIGLQVRDWVMSKLSTLHGRFFETFSLSIKDRSS